LDSPHLSVSTAAVIFALQQRGAWRNDGRAARQVFLWLGDSLRWTRAQLDYVWCGRFLRHHVQATCKGVRLGSRVNLALFHDQLAQLRSWESGAWSPHRSLRLPLRHDFRWYSFCSWPPADEPNSLGVASLFSLRRPDSDRTLGGRRTAHRACD